MACFFGGLACLAMAAIAWFAPWLLLAAGMWAGVVWPDLRGRRHRAAASLVVGALWVVAVALSAAGVVAFLAGVAVAFAGSWPLLRRPSEERSAATMDAQT